MGTTLLTTEQEAVDSERLSHLTEVCVWWIDVFFLRFHYYISTYYLFTRIYTYIEYISHYDMFKIEVKAIGICSELVTSIQSVNVCWALISFL